MTPIFPISAGTSTIHKMIQKTLIFCLWLKHFITEVKTYASSITWKQHWWSLPAILHVRTLLYCSRICDSRSFSILSQIRLTCLKVKRGMSRLFGESALKRELELHWARVWTQELSIAEGDGQLSVDDDDCDGCGGLALPAGKWSCFLFCRRRISIVRLAAICSETRNTLSIIH